MPFDAVATLGQVYCQLHIYIIKGGAIAHAVKIPIASKLLSFDTK